MTLFTNGYVNIQTPKDFDIITNKGEFCELSLVIVFYLKNISFK